jgi:Tfp pilus assembly protein PilF
MLTFYGYLLLENNDYKGAIEVFKGGLKRATTDEKRSELWGSIGDTYHEIGDDKKCFKAYNKALGYNPNNVLVLNNYAYFLSLEDRELERAMEMSYRAMSAEPNNASYVDTYAWILHLLGRNTEAKSYMRQALTISSQRDESLLCHYADILWALGEKFMAETYWQKAVERGYDKEEMERHIAEIKGNTKQ